MKILVKNAKYLMTMDEHRRIFRDGAVAIDGNEIIDVGKTDEVTRRSGTKFDETIDASRFLVCPGLIDTHVHLHEHVTRGIFPDDLATRPLVFQWELPLVVSETPEDEYVSALLALVEMIKTGTTCFIDAGAFSVESVAKAVEEMGIRGILGRAFVADRKTSEIPANWKPEWHDRLYFRSHGDALREAEQVVQRWHNTSSGRIRSWMILEGIGTGTDELYVKAREIAERRGVGTHYHMASSIEEAQMTETETGDSPITHLHKIGALGSNVLLVHMVTVRDEEIQLLKQHEVKIAHCPGAGLKIAKGITRIGRIPEMIDNGITVGLGCDGAASCGFFDMIRQMHLAAVIFKDSRLKASIQPSAEKALEMATVDGAKALLWNDIGSIQVGKMADVIMFDLDRPEWQPTWHHNIVQNLVYSATGDSVHTVIVDGKILMRNRVLTFVDEREIYRRINESSERVARAAGLQPKPKWDTIS